MHTTVIYGKAPNAQPVASPTGGWLSRLWMPGRALDAQVLLTFRVRIWTVIVIPGALVSMVWIKGLGMAGVGRDGVVRASHAKHSLGARGIDLLVFFGIAALESLHHSLSFSGAQKVIFFILF